MDKNYFPPPSFPLSVSNTTVSNLAIPNYNVEPLIVSNNSIQNTVTKGNTTTIIVDNSRVYNPTIVASTGNNNIIIILPNSNYVMKGNEKYMNSGWMLPAGMIPPGMAPITDFTITFEKSGTYYLCIIYPWMTVTIDVV